MIRKTFKHTKISTYVVHTPNPNERNFPVPNGTGFFITPNGYFLTANHVVKDVKDFSHVRFTLPEITSVLEIEHINSWPEFDIALLKTEFSKNSMRELFKERTEFPFLEIDFELHLEGTPVYTYGYPLSEHKIQGNIGFINFNTRVTSAIISSTKEKIKAFRSPKDARFYTIDNGFTYGNSGGPAILQETGKVFGVCARFQPVPIVQNHIPGAPPIVIPSSYGVVSSLANIQDYLEEKIL